MDSVSSVKYEDYNSLFLYLLRGIAETVDVSGDTSMSLLWNALQDNELPNDLAMKARDCLIHVLNLERNPECVRRSRVLKLCISNLENAKSIPHSLWILRSVIPISKYCILCTIHHVSYNIRCSVWINNKVNVIYIVWVSICEFS